MVYRIDFSREAERQIDDFFDYLRRYSPQTAQKYFVAFRSMLEHYLAERPKTFGFYKETGEPYRAFLFSVSSRTAYWVIYRVYDDRRLVRVLRFWNAAREPGTHRL
jgi:plasmid stabilization system protein ParE